MTITQIRIEKLFNIFDYTICFNLHHEEPVVILSGPNGCGKTTVLTMIDGLFNARYSILRSIPFKLLQVVFKNNTTLEVIESLESQNENQFGLKNLSVSLKNGDQLAEHFVIENDQPPAPRWLELIQSQVKVFFPRFNGSFSDQAYDWQATTGSPVSNQSGNQSEVAQVTQCAKELATLIRLQLKDYALFSLSLDRTFPVRLQNQDQTPSLSFEQFAIELSQLEQLQECLRDVGLFQSAPPIACCSALDSTQLAKLDVCLLRAYIQDMQQKLHFFDELVAKLILFKKFIKDKFQYKEIIISPENGFWFKSQTGHSLSFFNLSSGERRILILLYFFLFKVQPNSCILIDNPEASLHIVWQEQLLGNLSQIIQLTPLNVIIATHSPYIIDDKINLVSEPVHFIGLN